MNLAATCGLPACSPLCETRDGLAHLSQDAEGVHHKGTGDGFAYLDAAHGAEAGRDCASGHARARDHPGWLHAGRYLTVEMCDGHATQAQVIDLDTGKLVDLSKLPKSAKTDNNSAPCVFAGATVIESPVAVAEPVEFRVSHEIDFAVVRDLRPGRGIAAPPPPSTGPPSLI